MDKIILLFVIFGLSLVGCSPLGDGEIHPPITVSPLPKEINTAQTNTQEAEVDLLIPSFPYTPAQLAILFEPGKYLEGKWQSSSILDLTRPVPGYPCGDGYYGSCWDDWPGLADYGVKVDLLQEDSEFGEIVFLYYQDTSAINSFFEEYYSNLNKSVEDLEGLETWMISFNKFERKVLGEKWLHHVQYVLYDESTSTDPAERKEREVLEIKLAFIRCHGYVKMKLAFPPNTAWNNPDDREDRIVEQEDFFNLVYDYAQVIDQRITPYACNQ